MANRRLSCVKSFLVAKYCLMYLLVSSPMKCGGFLVLFCFNSSLMSILRGIVLLGSRFFILSRAIVFGVNPDCLIIVKKAFSLIGARCVILLIRFLFMIRFFKFIYPLLKVSFFMEKVSEKLIFICFHSLFEVF